MLDARTRKALAYVVRAQTVDDVQELLALYFECPNALVTLTIEPPAPGQMPDEVEALLAEGFAVMVEKDGELVKAEDAYETEDLVGIEAPVAWFVEAAGGWRRLANEVWRALRAGRPSLAPRPPRWVLTDTREWWEAADEAAKEEAEWRDGEQQPDPIEWIDRDWDCWSAPLAQLEFELELLDDRLPKYSPHVARLREEAAWAAELRRRRHKKMEKRRLLRQLARLAAQGG